MIWLLVYLVAVFLLTVANYRVHRNDPED